MPATSELTAATSQQAKPRILLADDSRVIRMAIKKILGPDYDLIEVGDGASAWDRIREDVEIQALVTDIEMPNVDGYELICRIRGAEDGRLRDMPVIAITGAEDEETKQRAFACGATDFIIKPIDAIQLKARIQAYLRYDQAVREQSEKTMVLEDQVVTDSMTGLCSKRYLNQRGGQDLAFAIRRENDLSLIRIDIDNFKKLYKTHGDDLSEDLLTWFAKLLFSCARTEDTVARIGGAEFAVLASATTIANAATFCQRLQETVSKQPYRHASQTIPMTLSMGVASLRQDRCDNIESLIKLAQQRLCHAQSEGGNRMCSSILPDTDGIEEVLAPSIEFDTESPLPDFTPDVVEKSAPSVPGELAIQNPELTLDLAGVTTPEEDATAELTLSDLDFSSADPEPVLNEAELSGSDGVSLDLSLELDDAPEMVPLPESNTLSVDEALHQLAQGRTDLLAPFLDALIEKVQPLMDLYARSQRRHASK